MKRPQTGIRSTRKSTQHVKAEEHTSKGEAEEQYNPRKSSAECNIFCYAALADKQTGTLYTDATGALPVRSLEGNQYYYVAYDYDHNYIFAEPITDVKDNTIVEAMTKIFTFLKVKGFTPTLNVTDHQAAQRIKTYLATKKCRWQFVEPSNHCVNAAERAIQTFKNHMISGLCSTDSK